MFYILHVQTNSILLKILLTQRDTQWPLSRGDFFLIANTCCLEQDGTMGGKIFLEIHTVVNELPPLR